ncbi:MAG: twin-arginine translocase TatA/TatE family subunit [Alphaproteobacteria bacterium]|jgi:sec-independent protein translocase protein TatA|nr:MAG: twin-arginine translocase TatA/TatE family subunit [Alphaproteobacteria bacterium]
MSVGFFQILLIALIVLLLFGSGRIKNLMSELGEGIRAFRKGADSNDKKKKKK